MIRRSEWYIQPDRSIGIDYRRVRVVSGQTDRIQYGIGAHASRASVMTGSATHAAALKARAKALDVAASLLQATPDELDIVDGIVVHRDRPGGGSISLAEIARHLAPDSRTLGERDPGLGWFRTEHMTYPYGVQIGVVRVDADTGQATVERFLLVRQNFLATDKGLSASVCANGIIDP